MAQAAEKAAAQEIEKSKVKAEDLKQITFFDSAMSGTLLDASVHWIKGSLRTNLPGIIGKISLKVSFFNKSEELIDVKKLSLENISVSRDAPVGFRSPDFNVANLPEGWKWNAEIIEAHYK